jgi:hypothetical protein
MMHLLILAVHLLATIAKLVRPGGIRAVVAESLLLKHQLLIISRARRRAPNLNSSDRLLLGLGSLFVPPSRIPKLAIILKPRTLFRFHEALKKRKYRWLFSSRGHRRPARKTIEGTHRRDRRVQTLQSPCWLSKETHALVSISTKISSAGCRETLSTRNGMALLAELYRAVKPRSVDLFAANRCSCAATGHGGDGRVHTPGHRIWRERADPRGVGLSDVQPDHRGKSLLGT